MGEGDGHDVEASGKKIKYPKHVFFILANEFCERFSYYGMRAILIIYLTEMLEFSDDDATVIYHAFTMLCYFTPLFGAMLADSLLGKFKTIFLLSIVYAAGNVVLSLSATEPIHIPQVPFSMIGLVLISIGTGGIKPCVSAFGGDQFILPQQEKQLASFFSVFYFSINSGSLISTFLTPIFRKDIKCFEADSCYPLAFGVPAALMITSLVVFLIGRPWYRIRKPEGNVVVAVLKTVSHALSVKRKSKDKKAHWLDYAEGKYSRREIEEIQCLLRVLFLYLPLPFFWALFDQQGSRWTLQASRMDGELSSSFTLKPDQMQVVNPLLVLAFIPMFDKGIYPLLARCNIIKKPLQRLTMGGIFAGIAFVISGVVELELQKTYPEEIGAGQSHFHIMNMWNEAVTGSLTTEIDGRIINHDLNIESQGNFIVGIIEAGQYDLSVKTNSGVERERLNISAKSEAAHSILIFGNKNTGTEIMDFVIPDNLPSPTDPEELAEDKIEKSDDGNPWVRIIQHGLWWEPMHEEWNLKKCNETGGYCEDANWNVTVILREAKKQKIDDDEEFDFSPNNTYFADWRSTPPREVEVHDYNLVIRRNYPIDRDTTFEQLNNDTLKLKLGGSYVIGIVAERKDLGNYIYSYSYTITELTEPNSMHMLWLLPQYIIMTMGEIMFSITIMDFSYQEAPKSMKSVMQSAWLMTVAFGNLIVVIIAEAKFFEQQWKEFFLFAGLMFLDMVIFSYMAYKYVPADRLAQNSVGENLEKKESDGEDNPNFDKD